MKKKIDNLIIVLGSPNDDDGVLLDIAKSRCDKAYKTYLQLCIQDDFAGDCAVLPTGGIGEHFNRTNTAHADYIKQYMIELGVPEDVFLEAALSNHTVEDAVLSYRVLKEYLVAKCYVVTSDYHVERVKFIFDYVYDNASTIIMVPATVKMSQEKQNKLIEHEKQALAGLKKNGIKYEGL